MSLFVTGFRRSGTSMCIHALDEAGIYIGEKEKGDYSKKGYRNPNGFWEHPDLLKINRQVIESFGRAWDDQRPMVDLNWNSKNLNNLYYEAHALMNKLKIGRMLSKSPAWAIKAPTTAIVLPFWFRVNPSMKVIWMLRNPIESAWSFIHPYKPNTSEEPTLELGLSIWKHRQEEFISFTDQYGFDQYHISSYSDWLKNPREEMSRIATFANIPLNAIDISKGAKTIRTDLYRNRENDISYDLDMVEKVTGDTYSRMLKIKSEQPH